MRHYSEHLGAFSVAKDGTIVMASPRTLEMTGYALFDLLGRNFVDFIAEESLGAAMQYFASTLEGNTNDVELLIRHKEGGTVRVRAHSEPDRNGQEILGAVGTLLELA